MNTCDGDATVFTLSGQRLDAILYTTCSDGGLSPCRRCMFLPLSTWSWFLLERKHLNYSSSDISVCCYLVGCHSCLFHPAYNSYRTLSPSFQKAFQIAFHPAVNKRLYPFGTFPCEVIRAHYFVVSPLIVQHNAIIFHDCIFLCAPQSPWSTILTTVEAQDCMPPLFISRSWENHYTKSQWHSPAPYNTEAHYAILCVLEISQVSRYKIKHNASIHSIRCENWHQPNSSAKVRLFFHLQRKYYKNFVVRRK